jgi:uncharacterized protein
MARPQKKQSLHPSELEFFDAFLEELKGPVRSFEALDGLFCALICAPRAVRPDEYIDLIMGSGGAFENETQAQKITDLMIRHFNSIVDQLQSTHGTDDIYVPALIVDENGAPDGREWASGFMIGVNLSAEGWPALMADTTLNPMIAPMVKLTAAQDPDPAQHSPDLASENREDLLEDMFVGLSDIYAHFAAERRTNSAAATPQTIRRESDKVGRNDACTCGSGKKFKQCCGAKNQT